MAPINGRKAIGKEKQKYVSTFTGLAVWDSS